MLPKEEEMVLNALGITDNDAKISEFIQMVIERESLLSFIKHNSVNDDGLYVLEMSQMRLSAESHEEIVPLLSNYLFSTFGVITVDGLAFTPPAVNHTA